ncbi:MAG: selenium-dependent molybdenum hydroxylase 1 [Myxococcales bacterium]|nr:selenium-dependent molybdenum hydroxylase 1 [Myxococcales bacterium]
MPRIELTVNGSPRAVDTHEGATLLEVLREGCQVTSPKDGCSPTGQCGCCTVLVDGQAKVACAMPAANAAHRNIVTLEGVDEHSRKVFARAFSVSAAVQCGFCIPGIVVRAHHILKKAPLPTRAEIAQGLGAHICRCTGYVKIVDAIELASKVLAGQCDLPDGDWSGKVGTSLPKYEGEELAMGDRLYIDDLFLPDMLHGAVVLSQHPRARVRGIDLTAARALPGVRAIVGAADVPGQRWQGLIYPDWPLFVAVGEETRYTGDIIVAIAADTRHIARRAAELVVVDYEVLEPLTSTAQALAAGAPLLHPENGHADNVLSSSKTKRGDADAALAKSAHVVTGTWSTQFIEHAFLEPEACLAVPRGIADVDGATAQLLRVYSQGQGVYDDHRQLCSALSMKADEVSVTLITCGGAFGGKEDLSIQAQTALLAQVTGKAVKLVIDRVESIRLHPKRHPIEMTYTVGCDAEGMLTAVKVRLIGDKGAYASVGSKVIERACGHATGAYDVANVDIEGVAVYTNNPPCGAMRGFGANQSGFAVESCVDMLAEKLGMDAWEIRWKNALQDGSRFCSGQMLNAVGLKATLQKVKPHYDAAVAEGKAVGLACGIKNVGIGNGMPDIGRASLTIEKDGTITLANGYTEMGQGLYTVLIQMACEVTGIDPRRFRATVDTRDNVQSGMTTASRATVCGGRAVVDAAGKLRADLDAGRTLAELAGNVYRGEFIYDKTSKLGAPVENPITHLSFGYATQLVILDRKGRIERLVAAHDVGRVINPKLLEGQLEGSIHMGLGFALSEELVVEGGVIQNPTLRGIGVLRAQWMPRIDILFVEEAEPEGPFGAKGVGEIGLLPTAPAVANALYRFDGIRRTALPMKDSPAARFISGKKMQ